MDRSNFRELKPALYCNPAVVVATFINGSGQFLAVYFTNYYEFYNRDGT